MTKLSSLKNNFAFHFAILIGAVFLFVGKPVPYSNEFNYLLRLRNVYDPGYLANDITFSTPTNEYWLFDHLSGLTTFLLPIEAIGWIGRIGCWALLLIALMRLGKRWEIPNWMISFSILLWLSVGQSIIADEWMFGGFEAKCVAYICLLFALDRFCDGRDFSSALLLGLTFALHPVVGFWAILAAVPALFIIHRDFIRTLKISAVAGAVSLIGGIPLLKMSAASIEPTLENLKIFQLVKLPLHFDPYSWSRSAIVLVCVMLVFCIVVHIQSKQSKVPNFLITFLAILGFYFVFGVLARVFELYEIMKYTPTRLFAVFIPLFFFLYLCKSFTQNLHKKPLPLLLLILIFSLSLWINLPARPFSQISSTIDKWNQQPDDLSKAFRWLSANSEKNALVIAPPWRYDFWYLSERAEIANNRKPIIADVNEWLLRLEKLTGKSDPTKGRRDDDELRQVYNDLTKTQIDSIAAEYKADYFVSESGYPYEVVFSSGNAKIYKLSPDK